MADLNKSVVIDMEEEVESEGATAGISEEEMNLIHTFRMLGLPPKFKSPDDVGKLMKIFGGGKSEESDDIDVKDPDLPVPDMKKNKHHYPKFSIFYGEENKGEASWETFRYEVTAALHDRVFDEEQIMFGIRRCLKGSAGDKLRRLGPDATVQLVIDKLDSAYGTVESTESIMRRFYTCEQKPNETVEMFASRLEELFEKAVELKGVRRSDTSLLKQVLHAGLKKELKHMSVYQCDKIKNYDEFKRELRRIEADLKSSPEEIKPCKPVVSNDKKETSELTEMLKKLNERIDVLEQAQQSQDQQFSIPNTHRGGWQGQRGMNRGRGENRGRGNYRPQRPLAANTFAPTCFVCNQKGHTQFNCPTILSQLFCTGCKTKGHIKRDCPN